MLAVRAPAGTKKTRAAEQRAWKKLRTDPLSGYEADDRGDNHNETDEIDYRVHGISLSILRDGNACRAAGVPAPVRRGSLALRD
jgi:hypothetical protein